MWNQERDAELLSAVGRERPNLSYPAIVRRLCDAKRAPALHSALQGMSRSMAIAIIDARVQYLRRDKQTFATTPAADVCGDYRKRHLVRVALPPQWAPADCELPPVLCFELFTTRLEVVDQVQAEGNWWIYIFTSRAMSTGTVCDWLAKFLCLDLRHFFVDVAKDEDEPIAARRRTFVRMQHVRYHLDALRALKAANFSDGKH